MSFTPGSPTVSAEAAPVPSDPAAIDAELRALHGRRGAAAAARLARLHEAAADAQADPAAARFHLTHAWVHALEAGGGEADRIEARLRRVGGLTAARTSTNG